MFYYMKISPLNYLLLYKHISYKMSFHIRTIIEKQVAFKILQLKLVTFKNESMLKVKYQNIK